ncbi:hypothetical protein J6590_045105 [Homalodisca vitripennis]|nr:hypothetical protein J6590_045105 [Homalodisca vitripennis]
MSTDSNRRMSSFGGTKNARKDPRPISEKAFQQMAQARVQQYFDTYGLEVIGPGNSIRRMNTKLFVDMMDHMLKKIDSRIVLTKTNFLEDLPLLLRKLGYRSKVDRSWLMTVNTSHSWQHVIGVLSWLVDILECVSSVEPFDMMIGNNLNDDEPNEEENAEDFPIDKDVIHHLKKSYRYKDDPMAEEIVDRMDSEYIDKMITDFKCTDEDFEVLEREIELKREEVDGEAQRKDAQLEMIEKLKLKRDALQNDCQNNEVFIEESNVFIRTTEAKLLALEQEIALKRTFVSKKQEELFKLQEKVSNQQISVHEKDKIAKEKHDLQRMIIFYENGIREYENSVFAVDLKSAETQRKLEKSIVEYNKIVAEKIIVEPRLKNVEVKFTLLSEKNSQEMDIIDGNLKTLKEEYKNSIFELKSKKEELENILWQTDEHVREHARDGVGGEHARPCVGSTSIPTGEHVGLGARLVGTGEPSAEPNMLGRLW